MKMKQEHYDKLKERVHQFLELNKNNISFIAEYRLAGYPIKRLCSDLLLYCGGVGEAKSYCSDENIAEAMLAILKERGITGWDASSHSPKKMSEYILNSYTQGDKVLEVLANQVNLLKHETQVIDKLHTIVVGHYGTQSDLSDVTQTALRAHRMAFNKAKEAESLLRRALSSTKEAYIRFLPAEKEEEASDAE